MLEKNKVYNLSEFCRVLRESQQSKQEFKAKKGENVDNEDKKNNGKAVKDILDQKYDGGIQNKPKREDPPYSILQMLSTIFICYTRISLKFVIFQL